MGTSEMVRPLPKLIQIPLINSPRPDLVKDGYAVVKGVLSKERAACYVDQIHEWLESFGLGYKRDDPSTIKNGQSSLCHISPRARLV